MLQIFETLSESMMVIHKLPIMLKDLKLDSDEESAGSYSANFPFMICW
jgi:hypothetical protein